MSLKRSKRAIRFTVLALAIGLSVSGCGNDFVILHPAGPVAASELNLIEITAATMIVIILLVWVLFGIALVRFREKPGNQAPYRPLWDHNRALELGVIAVSVVAATIIAIPTWNKTFALDRIPAGKTPIVIDVTSLDWKWLFEYPGQHIATVNYIDVPTNRPVLFELTANSPMNTFWVPQLGGMEYTMPSEVLPLWLEASKPGLYWGRSGNFSGSGFVHMTFDVHAVSQAAFDTWVHTVRTTKPPMTMADYRQLLKFNWIAPRYYSAYPAATFPAETHGFTLEGGMYMEMQPTPK
ncbi:cytochrome c oxidase subunit II [Sulfobacillus sp. hq2]|uniref:Cytochrome ubiquinol oxidase subunit II n=1 Tax=Sulfobacillus thermotolerans TaxID=338644 RepID=A0ABM6RUD0_9FIRM|nr:cytochrome c oxidase subunit II [Sulfobacillus sp. hq2]AUW94913.1 cytochrome ubiquinol oxidase subunit II [Sulfobacillus thermotolerans]POB09899.1 cytochrome ubiquinol oxidase subunit II [Sulfobacillus sp. hq2]